MKEYDLIIIGAGSGGLSAAAGASKLGLKTLLIEKRKLGGDCLWHGCIPSKVLIHEAEKMKIFTEEMKIDNFQVNHELHFKEAQKQIQMVQEAIALHDSEQRFESIGVDVLIGEAKFFSNNSIILTDLFNNQKKFSFKKCIIATGSSPRIPDTFKDLDFFTNDTFFEMDILPKSLLVIGGGSIGVEMASAMAMFGVKVKMILKEDRIMPKEEMEIGEFMMKQMEEKLGIEFYTFADIKKIDQTKSETKIILSSGLEVTGEKVLVCIGRTFNTNLSLDKASVKYSERGIEINEYLQTSNKNIYAIGDVNGFRLFTHAAGYQAKAALQNLIVPKIFPFLKKKSIPQAFPWVTYTYPEVAHVGNYKKELNDQKIYFKEYVTPLESVDRAKTAKIQKDGFISVLVGKKGKILGVTIVAPHAGELITEWVLAMENNLPVEAIFNTVHAYPTLSELNPRSTFEYMNEKLTPFKIKILKLLFKM